MSTTITVGTTGIPNGIKDIVEQLPDRQVMDDAPEITIRFQGDQFVYLTELALLAAWRKSLPSGLSVHIDDSHCNQAVKSFLSNTGFREVIETGRETPSATRHIGKLPLQPITNRLTAEATVKAVTEIFDEYAGQVDDSSPYRVLISELCENVLVHSESVTPGYIAARVLEQSHKVEIALADTGIGVRESYLRGSNDAAKERIMRGASPIDIALGGLESSKKMPTKGTYRTYYGFGLYMARRLIEENRGQFLFLSDDEATYIHEPYPQRKLALERPWLGTFVALVVDLWNPLPLDEIYKEATARVVPTPHRVEQAKSKRRTKRPIDDSSPDVSQERPSIPEPDALPPTRISVRHYGTQLLTRDVGLAIRADLASELAVGNSVVVDLDGVEDMTPSVADEAFGKLSGKLGFQDFSERVSFENGTNVLVRLIDFVMKTRSSRDG